MNEQYLQERDSIIEKYENRDKIAAIVCTGIGSAGFLYPLAENISTNGMSYSPLEVGAIGGVISALGFGLYKTFGKWNEKQKQKALNKLEQINLIPLEITNPEKVRF